MGKKTKRLQGTVQKIIQPRFPNEPEKAEIEIEQADHLYREIRVENVLTGDNGEQAVLRPGAEVELVIEADSSATMRKPGNL